MSTDYWAVAEAAASKRRAERDRRLSVPCPMPRCSADVGRDCTTPNGWATYHKARDRALVGAQPKPPRKHRLTDAQAQRIEVAAEAGRYFAPGQYATLGGDAAERAVADALERHGLIKQVGVGDDGCERVFELTAAGWDTYWHHRLVIRRLPDDRHPADCSCQPSANPDNDRSTR